MMGSISKNVIAFSFIFICQTLIYCQDNQGVDVVNSLKKNIKDKRLRIKEGIYKANVSISELSEKTNKIEIKNDEFFVAFSGRDLFKIHKNGWEKIYTKEGTKESDGCVTDYIYNNGMCILLKNWKGHIGPKRAIIKDGQIYDHKQHIKIGYFDARALGLYNLVTITGELDFSDYNQLFPFESKDLKEYKADDTGIATCTFIKQDGKIGFEKEIFKVDTKHDYLPINYEKYIRDRFGILRLVESNSANFTKLNNLWVPDSATISNPLENKSRSYKIDWLSVNEPVSKEHFLIKDFPIPDDFGILETLNGGKTKLINPKK